MCIRDSDGLERIVFAGRHLFERGGVYHQIHGSLEGSPEAPRVPDIADEEAQPRIGVLTAHLGLLQLVPAEDDEPARVVAAEGDLDELSPERSGPARNENRLVVKEHRVGLAQLGVLGRTSKILASSNRIVQRGVRSVGCFWRRGTVRTHELRTVKKI